MTDTWDWYYMADKSQRVTMSEQEMPRDDKKENPAELSPPPKRSTIRSIFRSFPTPSLRSVKGHQQAQSVRGHGGEKSTNKNEERISCKGLQSIGLSDDKRDGESNSEILSQGKEGGEERNLELLNQGKEGGEESNLESLNHSKEGGEESNLELLNQGKEGGEESNLESLNQSKEGGEESNLELLNQGKEGREGASRTAAATLLNFDVDTKLFDQGKEGGEERESVATASKHIFDSNSKSPTQGEEGAAASQLNFDNEEKKEFPAATSKDNKKYDGNLETNNGIETVGKPVSHTFCFHLIDPQKEQEPQPDSSSESHPLNTSIQNVQPTHPAASKPRMKTKKSKSLTGSKDGKDSDSSVSSRKRSTKNKTKIKSKFAPGSLEYIEERLCGRIFSGWVEERQWVECVGGYRDVIEVDEWEVEMNQQLQAIISSIPGVQEGTRWINMTPPDKNPYYCLWVLLEAPPTPGHYWYTITGTKLQPQFGLMISVKEIRSIHPHDGELAAARRKRLKKKSQGVSQNELDSVSEVLQDWVDQLTSLRPATVLSSITSALTLNNIKETIRFLTVLLMTLVIGLVTFIRESHVVGLRFVREAGIFFHNATPFLQTLLGFFEKIVGGLYLLVAMVYRDFRRPSVPPPRFPLPPPPPLTPSPPRPSTGPRAIQYVSPERWVVRTQNNEFT